MFGFRLSEAMRGISDSSRVIPSHFDRSRRKRMNESELEFGLTNARYEFYKLDYYTSLTPGFSFSVSQEPVTSFPNHFILCWCFVNIHNVVLRLQTHAVVFREVELC